MEKGQFSLKNSLLINNVFAVLRSRWFLRRADFLGPKVRVWGRLVLVNHGSLYVHDRVRIASKITPVELVIGVDARLEIGEGTYINYGCSISAMDSVIIGKNCQIGTYVNITDNNFHHVDPAKRNQVPASVPVCIEDNVWLGTRVILLPGVTIGEGSVIGAGSVVTKSIPSRVLAAGVPAKIIRAIP